MADELQLAQDLSARTGILWTPQLTPLALRLDAAGGWITVVQAVTLRQLLEDWDTCAAVTPEALRIRLARSDAGYPVARPVWDGVCQVLGTQAGTAFRALRADELPGDPAAWWDRATDQTARAPDTFHETGASWQGPDGAAAAWAFAAHTSQEHPVVVCCPLREYGVVIHTADNPVGVAQAARTHADPATGLLADALVIDHGTVVRVWHAMDAA